MLPSHVKPPLVNLLRCLCEDILFLIASSQQVSEEPIAALARRRTPDYEQIARGGQPDNDDWPRWVVNMSAAVAPVRPPTWMPMHELVGSVSLEAGARGVRSLFTSRPSEKEVLRARKIGSLTVRALTSVLGSDGPLRADELMLRSCLIAALGLPEEDERLLVVEQPMPTQALEVYGDMDPRIARLLVRGGWLAAFSDGIEPREDASVGVLAQKLGLTPEENEAQRQEVRARVDGSRVFGGAAVDAIRYVLSDEPQASARLAWLAANLALPMVYRAEPLAAIENGGPVVLARRHTLERTAREACLSLAWFAALATDPTQTRAAELASRHDRVATDLSAKSEGVVARSVAQAQVDGQLNAAVVSAGL